MVGEVNGRTARRSRDQRVIGDAREEGVGAERREERRSTLEDRRTQEEIGGMEDTEEEKLLEARPWSEAWYDFCLSSPVRGLRQVSENTPFTSRRILWLMVIIVGAAIFAYQTLNSVLYYRSWPLAVNVRVNYNETLQFPAVTICNLNAFRMTVAAKNNWYTSLTQLYPPDPMEYTGLGPQRVPGVHNVSMGDIHRSAGHQRNDLIVRKTKFAYMDLARATTQRKKPTVRCRWDGRACGPTDFRPMMSPSGLCYTFNGGSQSEAVRTSSVAGGVHGLQLLLNAEQYEYMAGPTEGAGIGVVVHSQQTAPLFPEHRHLVSIGEHTAMALSMLQVQREAPPAGSCLMRHVIDDVTSAGVDPETGAGFDVSSCLLRCKAQRIRRKCSCVDFWFPLELKGGMKACDIKNYHQCVLRVLAEPKVNPSACGCHQPCFEQLYDVTSSHVTLSANQVREVLSSNVTQVLQQRYLAARETAERTTRELRAQNTDLIVTVSQVLEEVSFALERVDKQLEDATIFLDRLLEEARPRITFHQTRALKGVRYVTQHYFIKGWETMNERTLDHVTTEFYETVGAFERTVAQLQQTPEAEVAMRRVMFFVMDRELAARLEIAIRAVDNLTKAYYAYLNAEPLLLEYVLTPQGRYDVDLIPAEVLAHNTRKQREYYNNMSEHLTGYMDAILGMQYLLKDYHRGQTFNESAYKECRGSFIDHAKQVNFYKSLFEQRIVHRAKDLIELKVEQFDRIKNRFYSVVDDIRSRLVPLRERLRTQHDRLQEELILFSRMAKTFLNSDTVSKRQLATMAHSKGTLDMVDDLKELFSDLRTEGGSTGLITWWEKLRELYTDIWRNFLKEPSVRKFYHKLKADVVEMVKNPEEREFFLDIFADSRMLHTSVEALNQTSNKNLTRMLNADFPDIGFKHKENDIIMQFNRIGEQASLVDVLGTTDMRFLTAFDNLISTLRDYSEDITINKDFVRDNLLRLDIYFRDLSYEVLQEHMAYSLSQLLSDVGGLLALFLGASALSLLELLDFVLHTGALKCYINRCHKGHKGAPRKRPLQSQSGHYQHVHHNTFDSPAVQRTQTQSPSSGVGVGGGGETGGVGGGGGGLPTSRHGAKVNMSPQSGGPTGPAPMQGFQAGSDQRLADTGKYMPRVAVIERSPGHRVERQGSASGDTAV